MDSLYKKLIIAGVAVVVLITVGVAAYVLTRPEKELPRVYENVITETKLKPAEIAKLQEEEEKVHTDEGAVSLEEGALEGNAENADPEAEAVADTLQKTAEEDYKAVYEEQQKQMESGELVVGEETDIENGVIAEEDMLFYSEHDDVLQEVNYSTEKAIEDIVAGIGPGTPEYSVLTNCDEKDWEQLKTNPYSSERLSIFFDEYKTYGDLESFKLSVMGWLLNGGDDGVAHGVVYG